MSYNEFPAAAAADDATRVVRLRPDQSVAALAAGRVRRTPQGRRWSLPADPVDIPPELIRLADEIAGKAFLRGGWGDRDDLFSAAMEGVWRAVAKAEQDGIAVDSWERWAASFVWWQLRQVRRRRARELAKWRGVRVRTGRRGDVGEWAADSRPVKPSERAERAEFWRSACAGLPGEQAAALLSVHRDGYGPKESAKRLGAPASTVSGRVNIATPTVVENLRRYRAAADLGVTAELVPVPVAAEGGAA